VYASASISSSVFTTSLVSSFILKEEVFVCCCSSFANLLLKLGFFSLTALESGCCLFIIAAGSSALCVTSGCRGGFDTRACALASGGAGVELGRLATAEIVWLALTSATDLINRFFFRPLV
jgi:hypothetical protein|tara:strand:- start:1101 stop:1463 length:363 start_codon:yes stop_codon:yes gene_type:complete